MGPLEGFIAISFLCRKLRKWLTRIPRPLRHPTRPVLSLLQSCLAPFPCTSRGWKLRSCSQRMTLVIGEADVRFDPHIWDPSALHVRIDRLASRARYGPWRASELFCEAISRVQGPFYPYVLIFVQQQRGIRVVRRGSSRNCWRSRNRRHLQKWYRRCISFWITPVGGTDSVGCGRFPR